MYKTIVVPIDGSDLAARAVPPAAWLAGRFGAELHLVTTTFAADIAGEEDALRQAAEHAGSVPVRTEVIRHAFPANGILDVAQADDEALLCLSTRGTSGLQTFLLGSVSDEVVRRAKRPIVLVGPECGPPADADARLLVCVDGSDTAAAALPVTADWALALGIDPDVVLVADAHRLASFRETAEAEVEDAAATLRQRGLHPTARLHEGSHPARSIVAVADETHASIIVLTTQGAGARFGAALGHVATDVVRHAHVPVLVVPAVQ